MDSKISLGTLRELWQQSNEKHWLPVRGISMLPLLREGDRLVVTHDLSGVRRGDILVFQQGDGLVAHRLVSISQDHGNKPVFRTKGDNSTYFDAPLSTVEILGRVDAISRNGREQDLTTIRWRLLNRLLAIFHLLMGKLFQVLRNTKQHFQPYTNPSK